MITKKHLIVNPIFPLITLRMLVMASLTFVDFFILEMHVRAENNQFQLNIEDDGVGCDPFAIGVRTENLQTGVKELGGRCSFFLKKGNGFITGVVISICILAKAQGRIISLLYKKIGDTISNTSSLVCIKSRSIETPYDYAFGDLSEEEARKSWDS
ncbi:hypothetical protein [Shimazuella kribbensis]|uniref:hypothetical protein n=1 Tax=Shimazuella kribbensis TaxID=139808 RepID=UPI00040EA979|nr:hypothetical protein [Shimazuella kribbensis]